MLLCPRGTLSKALDMARGVWSGTRSNIHIWAAHRLARCDFGCWGGPCGTSAPPQCQPAASVGVPCPCSGCNGRTKTGTGDGVCCAPPGQPVSSASGPQACQEPRVSQLLGHCKPRLALVTHLRFLLKSYVQQLHEHPVPPDANLRLLDGTRPIARVHLQHLHPPTPTLTTHGQSAMSTSLSTIRVSLHAPICLNTRSEHTLNINRPRAFCWPWPLAIVPLREFSS